MQNESPNVPVNTKNNSDYLKNVIISPGQFWVQKLVAKRR